MFLGKNDRFLMKGWVIQSMNVATSVYQWTIYIQKTLHRSAHISRTAIVGTTIDGSNFPLQNVDLFSEVNFHGESLKVYKRLRPRCRVSFREFPGSRFPGDWRILAIFPVFPGIMIRDPGNSRENPGKFGFSNFPFPGKWKSPGKWKLYRAGNEGIVSWRDRN